jgi:hypothetical protein
MHKRVTVAALLLTMLFASVPALMVVSGQTVAEKEGYMRIETTRATYIVNQTLVDRYGHQAFVDFLNFVDERFGKIMDITQWSSKKFYGRKLEVTVDPLESGGGEGSGDYGFAHILLGIDFSVTDGNLNSSARYQSWAVNGFLHEMTHGITPSPILTGRWLAEGFACFLSDEVQVIYGGESRAEVDDWYNKIWEQYVENGHMDFFFNLNRTIQEGYGSYITAWMLNNISKTYGWATHERFFTSLPDEYLYYMPNFSLSPAETSSYNYDLDSLFVGYYSLAAGTSLFSAFKSWGVKFLPNPITIICLNGTRAQSHAYASGVTVSLSAMGENAIEKIEYSFDRETWNTYVKPFLVSDDRFLYCKSTDNAGNTGPTTSITLRVESNSPTPPQPKPFPIALVAAASVAMVAIVGIGLLVYFKKRKR